MPGFQTKALVVKPISCDNFKMRPFGRIRIRICDPRSHRSRCIKGTELQLIKPVAIYGNRREISRHKNPRSPLIFRNGERLKNSTLHQCFLISENGWQIHFSPSVKLKKNTKYIACHPAPGKCQWIACFLESFSIVFPCIFQVFSHRITNSECHENMLFVDCFPAPRRR